MKIIIFMLVHFLSFVAQAETTNNQAAPFNQFDRANWPQPVEDSMFHSLTLIDYLDYRGSDETSVAWDIINWSGGDTQRIWIKSEGGKKTTYPNTGETDFQVLYGQLLSSYFDAQIGFRYEQLWGLKENPNRFFTVVGIQGLAIYSFELDTALFLSQSGDLSGRLTASEDFLFTQRLISQFRIEANAGLQKVEKYNVGSGLNDITLGFRLRYEIRRELAPYLGYSWTKRFGDSADFSTRDGLTTVDSNIVTGIRMWF